MTNEFATELINRRKTFLLDIVINSPVNIQLNTGNITNIFKLNNKIYVLEPVNLQAICYNPISPRGYNFDNAIFKDKLERALGEKVINVEEEKN